MPNIRYKSRFSLIVEQIHLLSLLAITWLEKLQICRQISNELQNDDLHYT